ncbi:nuclear transport factor 2 family protein [Paraburkholderia sp. JPY303]|uniref:nuclear transport factor 2 family protein n=1 Tax=Paraburkholderia atlantica TaxID=2654982 RepID=UPI001591C2EB|nr:nuclear transport factor 2 family protein [Paraburkholderia atlantica]NUY33550.1 nuclear transport factor 2 family protein [Paraburkholderia atlantica]
MNHASVKSAVDALEQQRCDATVSEDLLTLASLLDDDLTFVHSSGYVHDKPEYLTFLSDKIKTHKIVRGQSLAYHFLPELVITTGQLEQWLQRRSDGSEINIRALVTQVWIKRETGWKLLYLHSGRLSD